MEFSFLCMKTMVKKGCAAPKAMKIAAIQGNTVNRKTMEVKKDNASVIFREPAMEEGQRGEGEFRPPLCREAQLLIISAIWKATSRLCSALSRGSQVVR